MKWRVSCRQEKEKFKIKTMKYVAHITTDERNDNERVKQICPNPVAFLLEFSYIFLNDYFSLDSPFFAIREGVIHDFKSQTLTLVVQLLDERMDTPIQLFKNPLCFVLSAKLKN